MHHFKKVLPVAFLCGGYQSERRARIADYLRRQHAGEILVFYADDVWESMSRRPELGALEMEEKLAELSDLVLIVVESPGTFAELGAFALAKSLRAKLLPVLDNRRKSQESFIKTGPVTWVDKESRFSPSLWADHTMILEIVDELDERLERLPPRRAHRVQDLGRSAKHLLFFLADLAAIFGPCPLHHLSTYAAQMVTNRSGLNTEALVNLGVAMDVIQMVSQSNGPALYYRRMSSGRLHPFQENRYLHLSKLRASVLGVMMKIPEARDAIRQIST